MQCFHEDRYSRKLKAPTRAAKRNGRFILTKIGTLPHPRKREAGTVLTALNRPLGDIADFSLAESIGFDSAVDVHPKDGRWAAMVEIMVAFALVHVAFRSFKHFTEPGRLEMAARVNFSPGAAMILATLLLTIVLAMILSKDRAPFRMLWPVSVFVLILIVFALPLAVALNKDKPLAPVLLVVLWTVFGAGFGEEMFYRGYIQSRVDLAWGKPFRIAGVNFGAGLIVSSLLFGFLHALNTVDYFHRRFDFA